MDQNIIFLFAGVIALGGIILWLICTTKEGKKYLNVEYYRTKCLEVEHQLKRDNFASYHLSVLNADKLLDKALTERGFSGNSTGEKMKHASKVFSDNNGIWNAHKLRNKVAHKQDAYITYEQAKSALANFRQALKDLGAI